MTICALIVAAGMSSRMGQFKPLLKIGSESIAQRIIHTFHGVGINKIIMVTGNNADILEQHLTNYDITFLRNEAYKTTQMFDSVKLGLDYLKDKCDAVLLTPVDIPLFTSETVAVLKESDAKLACPEYNGQTGHPILISTELIPAILADSGEQGLRSALTRCGETMKHIPVSDFGILQDVDTPEEYSSLLAYYHSQQNKSADTHSVKRLILLGEIGYGKTSMIRSTLGISAKNAGGFVTVRRTKNDTLLGFDLAPAGALVDPSLLTDARCFLDFTRNRAQDNRVFAEYGTSLLMDAKNHPFAIADEFGGLELMVPDFYKTLLEFLQSSTPCIGVMKTSTAAMTLSQKLALGEEYFQKYQFLLKMLESDPDPLLLPVNGWQDEPAVEAISAWANQYARR